MEAFDEAMAPDELSMRPWLLMNLDWEYKLWADSGLVNNKFMFENWLPKRLATFNKLKKPIVQSDFSRYGYMYVDGGIYADLDMDCLQPMENLLKAYPKAGVIVAMMGKDFAFDNAVPNAFMASMPKHPMWVMCMDMVKERLGKKKVEDVAGPTLLQLCLEKWVGQPLNGNGDTTGYLPCKNEACKSAAPVALLDNDKIFPVNWRRNLPADDTSQAQKECLEFCEKCTDMTASRASVHFGEAMCLKAHRKCFSKLKKSGAFASTCWTKSWQGQ